MRTPHPRIPTLGAALLGVLLAPAGACALAPVGTLPPSSCSLAGSVRTCQLWAEVGATNLPGLNGVPVWAFVGDGGDTPRVPGGPVLVVNQGETVHVVLHNELPSDIQSDERLALAMPQLPGVPDGEGIPPGASTTYSFTASDPGTYLYEAGNTINARHQTAMGLYGAIVVRPASGATAATLATTGFADPNANLSIAAVTPGPDGNAISIAFVDPLANDQPLSVSVLDSAISVSLATDGTGAMTSTAADVAAAIAASPAAGALVSTTQLGDGSGVVGTFPAESLTGGAGMAYGPAASFEFDDEAVLVTSELDPVLNQAGDPSAFDLQALHPTYWLLNGRTYNDSGSVPSTGSIPTLPGHRVLLRYVNAGLDEHPMGLLGMHQTVIAQDARPLRYSYDVDAETLAPGATLDSIGNVPGQPRPGKQLALFDQGQHLDLAGAGWNDGGANGSTPITTGGALTFLAVPGTFEPCGGPEADAGTAPPYTNGPPLPVSVLFAGCTPAAPPGASQKTVDAAEYFIDAPGADGSGTDVPITTGVMATAAFAIDPLTAGPGGGPLASGQHIVYTHARDSAGKWGALDAEVFYYDLDGPITSALSLTPPRTNGSGKVVLNGTASDIGQGDQKVTQAEYFVDTAGANGTGANLALSVPGGAVTEGLSKTLTATQVNALGEGQHQLLVHARDALGNWGPLTAITLVLDRTAPATSGVTFAPSPNNGTISIDPNSFELEVRAAAVTDPVVGGASSNIVAVEGFLDSIGTSGRGTVFLPADGAFNSSSEPSYQRILLAQVNSMTPGFHTFYVHGKDAAGNWGAYSSGQIVIDKTGPASSGVAIVPATIGPADLTVALSANLSDPLNGSGASQAPGSSIVAAEYYVDSDPGKGNGTPMSGTFGASTATVGATVATALLTPGSHTIYVRGKDNAGNWGPSGSLLIGGGPLFADSFASGSTSAWNAAVGGTALAVTTAAHLHGGDPYGLAVTLNGTAGRYVQDTTPSAENQYHARFYVNPAGLTLATGSTPDLLVGYSTNNAGTVAFRIQMRRTAATFQLRIRARNGTGQATSNWTSISSFAHAVEIAWQAGAPGSAVLYIDGTAQQTLSGLANASTIVESVRLGPTGDLPASAAGTLLFDEFVSTRSSVIGP